MQHCSLIKHHHVPVDQSSTRDHHAPECQLIRQGHLLPMKVSQGDGWVDISYDDKPATTFHYFILSQWSQKGAFILVIWQELSITSCNQDLQQQGYGRKTEWRIFPEQGHARTQISLEFSNLDYKQKLRHQYIVVPIKQSGANPYKHKILFQDPSCSGANFNMYTFYLSCIVCLLANLYRPLPLLPLF